MRPFIYLILFHFVSKSFSQSIFILDISCDASGVNNAHTVSSETTYNHNEQVTYACDTGFEHTDGNLTRNCTAMNTWSGIEPTCTRM